jgi:hypothetical protein
MHPAGSAHTQHGDEGTEPTPDTAGAGVVTPEAKVPPEVKAPGRRRTSDRRQAPTPMFSSFLFRGRRRGGRREGETIGVYVDRHGLWMYAAFLAMTTLSILDARFTLHALNHGGTEANPIMRAALHLGDGAFVILKTAATIAGAAFLVLHKTWRLGRLCLVLALAAYVALTVLHLYGVTTVLPPMPS